jgi:hypothetical protein
MSDTPNNCPVCNRPLRQKALKVTVKVPDGAKSAPPPPGAVVVRKSHLRREGKNIVQDLFLASGQLESEWVPFCGTTCAARFAVDAWTSGVRPQSGLALEAPPKDTLTEADAWAGIRQAALTELPALPEPPKAPELPALPEGKKLTHNDFVAMARKGASERARQANNLTFEQWSALSHKESNHLNYLATKAEIARLRKEYGVPADPKRQWRERREKTPGNGVAEGQLNRNILPLRRA